MLLTRHLVGLDLRVEQARVKVWYRGGFSLGNNFFPGSPSLKIQKYMKEICAIKVIYLSWKGHREMARSPCSISGHPWSLCVWKHTRGCL